MVNEMLEIYLIVYNILFVLSLPLIVFAIVFNNKHRKDFFYKLSERFAFYKPLGKNSKKTTIWIHCASLGEVIAVEPILNGLQDYYVVLTTITKSGRQYAQKLQKADFVTLLPLDIYPIMNKAFNSIKPDILVLVETELWATMLYTASHKNIKAIIINGRMSEKSYKSYKRLKFFWNRFVGLISIIIARSKDDADRFSFLTNGKSNIIVSGNIKYDSNFTTGSKRDCFLLSEDDFIFTAGSTRKGEDEIIADVYNKIIPDFSKIKFFLAPRHLSRIEDVIKILEDKHIKYSLFSTGDFSNNFILIDIFGELQSIYSISDVCYVGGSIVDKGGQNPIEPAAYGKPVLFGKNMGNFKTEAKSLVKAFGALIVDDSDDLAKKIREFISNKQLSEAIGKNALKTVNSQKGVASFTIEKIKENLNA
ncbi:3-deoxy-D-manno-octulosonic acid transferase [Endomicrobiia bacterium]|nr:3-deoxy-D-manno-octulosonic acid transferase [Endomicrobiia bacterium]